MTIAYPVTLFYDGACHLCLLEMDNLKARNVDGRLAFVDISAPGFDAADHGLVLQRLHAAIHGVTGDGRVLTGMEVLRAAYGAVGLGWVLGFTRFAPTRRLFDAAYLVLAGRRSQVSRWLGPGIRALHAHRARQAVRRMARCQAGQCDLRDDGSPRR